MTWLPLAAAGALLLGNPVVVTRARTWWRARSRRRRDFCETCNAQPRRIYVVSSTFGDDDALGMGGGRTAMTATYCRRHRPNDARPRANPRR